jgi:hypothetical protein
MDKILKERLTLIFEWYKGLVSEETGRLVYIYAPAAKTVVAEGTPIRDIASVWDMENLSDFLNRRELEPVSHRSFRECHDQKPQ